MDLDETTEQILEIFSDETRWDQMNDEKNYLGQDTLNVKGVLRERVKTLLSDFEDDAIEQGQEHANEDREPAFNPHELD